MTGKTRGVSHEGNWVGFGVAVIVCVMGGVIINCRTGTHCAGLSPSGWFIADVYENRRNRERQNVLERETQGEVRNWYSVFSALACVGVVVDEARVVVVAAAACCP